MQKKILAINDISCVGRCSLTVTLPIVSSCGIECSILPTAILSTHTGGFKGYTFKSLDEEMIKISEHWETLGIKFDCIYTGFLGSIDQIDIVANIIDKFKTKDNFILVDPAMADNGVLYPIFDNSFALEMKKLCMKADIITPNVTEACLLTNTEYMKAPHSSEFLDELLLKLKGLGVKQVFLTGVSKKKGELGCIAYDAVNDVSSYYKKSLIEGYYHGTGDVFSSILASTLTLKKPLDEVNKIAVNTTVKAIKETLKYDNIDLKYGVNFEEVIPYLLKQIRGK